VVPVLLRVIRIMSLLCLEMLEQTRRGSSDPRDPVIKPREAKIKIMEEIMIDGHIVYSNTELTDADGEQTISHHTYAIYIVNMLTLTTGLKLN
jgi:hypothetical protein